MKMPKNKIAVTLFNLRDFCKTAEDLDATLAKLVKIGYKAVQVSAVYLPPEVIREKLDKYNLFCCAAHAGFDEIINHPADLGKKMNKLGCDYVALGSCPDYLRNPFGFVTLAQKLTASAKVLKKYGVRLGYHNHCEEFDRMGSPKVLLEYLIENTKDVFFEIDVHWVTRGGANPAKWLEKLAGRVPVIHIKDFTTFGREPQFCEIGEGNLDWPSIFEAADKAGTRWFSIEQDRTFRDRSIFESMQISYDNLAKMGRK